jgi:hypothetical protein
MKTQPDSDFAIMGFIYLFSAVTCSSISAISTYAGLRFFPPLFDALISAVIFMLLLACDFSILRARRDGGGIFRAPRTMRGPVIMLSLVTIVSTSMSFTFFYSIAMRDRLAATRAKTSAEMFEANYLGALHPLHSIRSATSTSHEIDLALSNLETQVMNSGRPGFGIEALEIVRNIFRIMDSLGAPLTPMAFPPPPATPSQNQIALERFKAAVEENLSEAKAGDGVSPTIAKIKAIVQLEAATVDIERDANSVLGNGRFANTVPVKLPYPGIAGIRLYTAPEVYSVAFSSAEGMPYAVGSLGFALMLDIFPLLLAVLLVHPSGNDSGVRGGRLRGAAPDLNITGSTRW